MSRIVGRGTRGLQTSTGLARIACFQVIATITRGHLFFCRLGGSKILHSPAHRRRAFVGLLQVQRDGRLFWDNDLFVDGKLGRVSDQIWCERKGFWGSLPHSRYYAVANSCPALVHLDIKALQHCCDLQGRSCIGFILSSLSTGRVLNPFAVSKALEHMHERRIVYREPYGVEELIQERHMKRASIEFNRYYTVYIYMYVYIPWVSKTIVQIGFRERPFLVGKVYSAILDVGVHDEKCLAQQYS